MQKILIFFCSFMFFSTPLKAAACSEPIDPLQSWWTGPIFAPSGYVVNPGQVLFEPYFFSIETYGIYDAKWKEIDVPHFTTLNPLFVLATGIAKDLDITLIGEWLHNKTENQSYNHIGDTALRLSYQIMREKPHHWRPAIRIIFSESFPTGKYEHLDPKKLLTDVSGDGSYTTYIGFILQKIIPLTECHLLRLRVHSFYSRFSNVRVKGLNAYGGWTNTCGKIHPGDSFTFIGSFEFSLTQNWVFASELVYIHQNKITFRGNPGNIGGIPAPIGLGSSELWSTTPSIEYNFNIDIGIIAGVWLSFAGRNSSAFFAPVIAVNCYF